MDHKIQSATQNGENPVGFMDQRDSMINELAKLVPIRVSNEADNSVNISMTNGTVLYNQTSVEFEFNAYGNVNPQTTWDGMSSTNQLGSIYLKTSGGGGPD